MTDHPYTRADITAALAAGTRLIQRELALGERDMDLITLVVNATVTFLDHPDATFNQMVGDNYACPPSEVRGWWSAWT